MFGSRDSPEIGFRILEFRTPRFACAAAAVVAEGSGYYVSKLKVYKNILQSLSDRAVENIAIKKLLRKHTEIIPLILKPHFKDGGGVSSGEEDDVRSADESVSE